MQVRTAAGTVAVVPGSSGIGVDLDRAIDEAMSTGRVEARLLPHIWSTQIAAPLQLSSTHVPAGAARERCRPSRATPDWW